MNAQFNNEILAQHNRIYRYCIAFKTGYQRGKQRTCKALCRARLRYGVDGQHHAKDHQRSDDLVFSYACVQVVVQGLQPVSQTAQPSR